MSPCLLAQIANARMLERWNECGKLILKNKASYLLIRAALFILTFLEFY